LQEGIPAIEFLSDVVGAFTSRGEARRMVKDNGVSINKEKINEEFVVNSALLLNNRYILIQKGKKNFYLVKAV
jgi:tyrosyl-tRNA synthetase